MDQNIKKELVVQLLIDHIKRTDLEKINSSTEDDESGLKIITGRELVGNV